MSTVEETEAASAAIATAPRVSLQDIKNAIARVYYMNGETFVKNATFIEFEDKAAPYPPNVAIMTICMVELRNGFMVIGKSAPASPANFDINVGRKHAYDECIRQLWPLMGFVLKTRLHEGW